MKYQVQVEVNDALPFMHMLESLTNAIDYAEQEYWFYKQQFVSLLRIQVFEVPEKEMALVWVREERQPE